LILPTSPIAVLLLLVLAFFCLGSWINGFKPANSRFEFFSIDFAVGALLCSLVAAYTLGTFGSELTFADRFLVASRTAQGFTVSAAFLFALGNTLLLAGVAILGISVAFPLAIGLALAISCLIYLGKADLVLLIPGLIAALVSSYFAGRALQFRKPVAPAKGSSRRGQDRTFWGVIASVISGIALGFVYPVVARGITGDFGLAAYAGLILFCAVLLGSTVVLDFFFVRIGIEGKGVTTLRAYFGKAGRHTPGLLSGVVWAVGALAVFLAISAPAKAAADPRVELALPVASVLLAVFWGVTGRKELARMPKGKSSMAWSVVLFVAALVLLGWAFGG
jgi:glucose uptake protein